MKQYSISLGLAVMMAAVTFTSCSSDEQDDIAVVKGERVIGLTSTVLATRGTADVQTNQLANGVQVGAFGVSEGTTITNGVNNAYTADGIGGLTRVSADMSCSGSATIYAYAPYQSSWTSYSAAQIFSVSTDQSADGYLASDLLWASADATSGTASLSFTHKLSRVCITLTNKTAAALSDVSVSILNTKIATTLNPSTGALGDASNAATITLVSNQSVAVNGSVTAYGIIVPQEVEDGQDLVAVTYGAKTIKWSTNGEVNFASGNAYTIAIEITDTSISGQISTNASVPAL